MNSHSPIALEICILAGGLSRRMGRDKARLRLGRRTLLGHIRASAQASGLPVRVIRKDAVPRCGPLGGVFTALETSRADAAVFLACDMPFITGELLRRVRKSFGPRTRAMFVQSAEGAGFPFVLRRDALALVSAQIEKREFSLQRLARRLKAKRLRMPVKWQAQLQNINTPEELATAGSNLEAKR